MNRSRDAKSCLPVRHGQTTARLGGRLVRDAKDNSIGFILIPPLVFDPEGSDPKGGRTDGGVPIPTRACSLGVASGATPDAQAECQD